MAYGRNELIDLMMVFPRKTANISRILVAKYLGDSRIRPHHLMILKVVSENDGVSQKDLTDRLPFDKSYISTSVRELIDMGMLVNGSEGKVHRITITPLGKDIVQMGNMMFDLVDQSVFGNLTDEERDTLVAIMKKIDAHTDALIEKLSASDS